MSSPYDHTNRFLRGRYDRNPLAFSAFAVVLLWSLWTIFEIIRRAHAEHTYDTYLLASTAMSAIGRGVIVAAGLVWLIEVARGRS